MLLSLAVFTGGCAARPQRVALGVAADDVATLDSVAVTTGRASDVYEWYQAWAEKPAFDADRASAAAKRGAFPLLTWEPWSTGGGVEQPEYSLARIVAGDFDTYIATFADQIRTWNGRLGLRFLHELNAPYYPWGAGVNGNSSADAIAAWKHVREIFWREGANSVVWIWSANVHAAGTVAYEPVFPGDAWVDWVGLDGYNGGTALPWGGWRSPEEIFGSSIDDLVELSDRPLAITEVGSVEQGGDKARWIKQLFALALGRGVLLLIWFQYDKEADWRLDSSPAAAAAFRSAVTIRQP